MIVPDEVIRSNRRTLSLSILKNGKVVVKAPTKMREETISNFISSKQGWIQTKLNAVYATNAKFQDVISMEKVLIFGNKYSILLADTNKIELGNNLQIIFPTKIAANKRIKNLKTWLKKFAKSTLEQRLNYIANQYNFKPSAFKINDSSGRWGSCNSRGTICINFRVMMLPPAIADYILIHELCHLKEMNHSPRFWQLVSTIYSQVKAAREELKHYGFLLSLYKNS